MKQQDHIYELTRYFSKRNDVAMAFLFGSYAKGQACTESDADIAVYFTSPSRGSALKDDVEFASEDEVWVAIEKIVGREVDLLILNRAAPLVAYTAMKGIPLIIKDRNLYLSFFSQTMNEALDFQQFIESWWQWKRRRRHGTPARRQGPID